MKQQSKVTIIPSVTLEECKLNDLIGRQGIVEEVCYRADGTIRGCWISLIGEPYLDEQEWYIPTNSLSE